MSARSSRAESASARAVAFDVLRRVEERSAFASLLLERRERRLSDRREGALARELVLGVLRWRGLLDHVLARHASRPLEAVDPAVLTAMRLGAYSILFLDRVPDFAAVDTAVALARRHASRAGGGFANAVLRSLARAGASALPPRPERGDVAGLAIRNSHPPWWVERLVARDGWDAACAVTEANNRPAPAVLRPNLKRTTPRDLQRRLEAEGVVCEPCSFVPEALRVVSGVAHRARAVLEGFAWAQDEASQLVPMLFGRVLRPRVADVGAAPGTKTMQLAEGLPAGGLILALDRHPGRLGRARERFARLGSEGILTVVADLEGRPPVTGVFDHVLVDAPCSGTGTLRRHPEIRWRLDAERIASLAASQGRILAAAASLVARGGSLVYAVCSVEPEEGARVVEAFLSRHPSFRVADPRPALPPAARRFVRDDGTLTTSPAEGLDGFFAAVLLRR